MFLDPDDYLELNACEECVRILNTEKKVILYGLILYIKDFRGYK